MVRKCLQDRDQMCERIDRAAEHRLSSAFGSWCPVSEERDLEAPQLIGKAFHSTGLDRNGRSDDVETVQSGVGDGVGGAEAPVDSFYFLQAKASGLGHFA